MVSENLRQAHFQEVDLTQILADLVSFHKNGCFISHGKAFGCESRALTIT